MACGGEEAGVDLKGGILVNGLHLPGASCIGPPEVGGLVTLMLVSPQTCSQKSPPGRNRAWEIREPEGMENRALWMVFGPIRISGNWIIWGPP